MLYNSYKFLSHSTKRIVINELITIINLSMCIFCMCLRFIIYVWNRINAILNWCWWNLCRAEEMNSKKKKTHSKTQFLFWRVDSQLCWRDEHTEWTREIQIFISIAKRLDKLKKRELRNIAIWKKDKKQHQHEQWQQQQHIQRYQTWFHINRFTNDQNEMLRKWIHSNGNGLRLQSIFFTNR